MKKLLTLVSIAGLTISAFAQESSFVRSAVQSFYDSVEWQRAFVGYYGVNPGVEPGIPEDQVEREALAQIRDLLRTGSDEGIRQAATLLQNTIQTVRQSEGGQPSPMLLQISGTLQMRLAELANSEAERKRITDQAASTLRQAIDPETGFPNFLRAHKNLANLLFRADRQAEAKVHFIRAIELGDRDAVTFGLLGAILLDEDKLVSAESALRNSLMINPNVVEFKQLLGQTLLQQERYNEARSIFSELLQVRPNNTQFWMAQANTFVALDQIDEAAKNLEIVRLMGGANSGSLMLLGDVYMNKDMVEDAFLAYMEAVEIDASGAMLERYVRSAETIANFGAYEMAMEMVAAIDAAYGDRLDEQEEINLLSLRSEINLSLGQTEEAVANLESLLTKDPFNARALLTLAGHYSTLEPDSSLNAEQQSRQELRNQQQAIIYYERAQNLDEVRSRVRAYIGEAQLRVRRDELDQAARLLETAQSLMPQEYIQSYLDQIRSALRARRG
jgi:tetratricopeptide (TPR) repeat protein